MPSNKQKNTTGGAVMPRNPVARSPLLRKGGVHEQTATTKRRQASEALAAELEDWREDVAFEQSIRAELDREELESSKPDQETDN
ncbi:MAG: hypothetical protein AAF431_11460 [Pseudomonadota bacterium]